MKDITYYHDLPWPYHDHAFTMTLPLLCIYHDFTRALTSCQDAPGQDEVGGPYKMHGYVYPRLRKGGQGALHPEADSLLDQKMVTYNYLSNLLPPFS